MEQKIVERMAEKLGIKSNRIIRKAKELSRLCEVKMGASGLTSLNLSGPCKAVVCLDLAAATLGDRSFTTDSAVKISGVNKKVYENISRTIKNSLGLESNLTLRDLTVQLGYVGAESMAQKILDRYYFELPDIQKSALDLTKPMFTTSALFVACKHLKVKADKRKLLGIAGVKKSCFDKLCNQMTVHLEQITREQAARNQSRHHQNSWFEQLDLALEEDDGCSPSKRKKYDDEGELDSHQPMPDYEEWKKKILENASAALATE